MSHPNDCHCHHCQVMNLNARIDALEKLLAEACAKLECQTIAQVVSQGCMRLGGTGSDMQAIKLARRALMIEVNPDYIPLIEQSCRVTPGLGL